MGYAISMPEAIVITATAAADLEPQPIPSEWILARSPEARAKLLAKSHDGASRIMVWECTAAGSTGITARTGPVVVIAGEVFVTTEIGEERRLGEGDMGFFPAGSSAIMARPRSDQKSSGPSARSARPVGIWSASLAQASADRRPKRQIVSVAGPSLSLLRPPS